MRSIVICCSKRFKDEVHVLAQELTELGVTVYAPDFRGPMPEDLDMGAEYITENVFAGLTLKHFDWIRKADVCYVYNQNDYIGKSVALEMGYATALGKPIFAHSKETGDPCPNILIDKVASSAKEILDLLS